MLLVIFYDFEIYECIFFVKNELYFRRDILTIYIGKFGWIKNDNYMAFLSTFILKHYHFFVQIKAMQNWFFLLPRKWLTYFYKTNEIGQDFSINKLQLFDPRTLALRWRLNISLNHNWKRHRLKLGNNTLLAKIVTFRYLLKKTLYSIYDVQKRIILTCFYVVYIERITFWQEWYLIT